MDVSYKLFKKNDVNEILVKLNGEMYTVIFRHHGYLNDVPVRMQFTLLNMYAIDDKLRLNDLLDKRKDRQEIVNKIVDILTEK